MRTRKISDKTTTIPSTPLTTATTESTGAAGAPLNPRIDGTPANWDAVNAGFCDMTRLPKALVRVAILAGRELLASQQELGDQLEAFINKRTPWQVAEARAAIAFAAQCGLTPEMLEPGVAVSLAPLFEAMERLGREYMQQTEAATPRSSQ